MIKINHNMIESNYPPKSPRQRKVEFLINLREKTNKAKPNKESLYPILCEFVNFCVNMKITNGFSGLHSDVGLNYDENLKNELVSNIEMAIAVASSRQSPETSKFQLTQINQQTQNLNVSIISESLRKGLTGEQYDEIMEMLKNKADQKSVKEKLLGFGKDVAAGILSTILSSMIM